MLEDEYRCARRWTKLIRPTHRNAKYLRIRFRIVALQASCHRATAGDNTIHRNAAEPTPMTHCDVKPA
ncbi:hypothetical protein KCP76_05110 [Salmonella enterica subsp. enterica serovar Weltevreden]|nr:hypothetical protein KCP76_05110 [Salmonella enterica subsp. enterica serovar Weltevreden]